MRFLMKAAALINNKLVLVQFSLLFLLFAVVTLMGPPRDQGVEIPQAEAIKRRGERAASGEANRASDSIEARTGGAVEELSEASATLSEVAPGRLSHKRIVEKDGRYWGLLDNGWRARLSLDPRFQEAAERHFSRSHAALGAIAMMEIDTGRLIGLSEYHDPEHVVSRRIKLRDELHMGLRALAPSAGGFRLITYIALLEKGLNPQKSICYTKLKGLNIQARHLENRNPGPCKSLERGFVDQDLSLLTYATHSQLKSADLKRAAVRAGFGQRIPYFDLPYELSKAHVPTTDIARVKTALGLQNTKMSTLQAVMISSMIANGGQLLRPQLVDLIEREDGTTHQAPRLAPLKQTGIKAQTARHMRKMMRDSLKSKELSAVFEDWPSELSHARVAGQLSRKTYREPIMRRYTWFIGFAPAQRPKWAFAAMVLNSERWYVRAEHLTQRVLKEYLPQLLEQGAPR